MRRRSKWKGIFIHTILYKFANTKFKNLGPNWLNQKLNVRSSTYIKRFISRSIMIHNGISFVNFRTYNENYINIKMGQFVFTRSIPPHSLKSTEKRKFNRKLLEQRNKLLSKSRKPKFKNLKNIIK